MTYSKPFALAALVAALAFGTVAQSEDVAAVQAMRQDLMKSMGVQFYDVIGGMAKGKTPYDASAAKAAAEELAKLAGQDFAPFFIPGSDMVATGKGHALPVLWDHLDDAMAKHEALVPATVKLAQVAGDGLDALKAAAGEVGGACGACHKVYRAPF
jgi:cytochrome c556